MLGEVIKLVRKDPLLGPRLVAINAGFFLFVYGVYVLSSQLIASSRASLFALASGGVLQRAVVLLILLVVLLGLPLMGYVVARLWVLRSIESAQHHRLTPWGQLGWRCWSLLKWAFVVLIVTTTWLWSLTLLRQEFLGSLGLVSGIILFAGAYLWLQALALVDPKKRALRDSLELLPLLLRSSWPLVASSLAVIFILLGGFYLGGSLWAGSFSKVVYVTTKEWGRYVFLFRAALVLAVLLIVSFAQVYYARLRPSAHNKQSRSK